MKATKNKTSIRQCDRCEKSFIPNARHEHDQRFCSRECKYNISDAVCYCVTCNKRFIVNHKKKYCSNECNPHYKEPFPNKDIRMCESCNTEYLPKYRAQRFCSRECRKHGYISVGYKNSERTFYNSKEWKAIKTAFKQSFTHINGIDLSNKYCIQCYIKQNRLNDMYAVDHIIRVKDGGTHDHSNLQSLCRHHHQSKSAVEGNSIQHRNKGGRPRIRTLTG